jgi:ATP-dependent protease HslVU (ClpYQ) peptidase subunit
MTCVVGLVSGDRVHIGVDSAAISGWTRRATNLKKVFRRGPFLIGYTTSFRMGQLLEHQLDVPPQTEDQSEMAFMVGVFVESTRRLLKERGFAKIEANSESGGQFLVGYRGKLYSIESDFQVGEMSDGFDAIGSGAEVALGAMKALEGLKPAPRIRRALEIASHFNMGVSPPYHVKSLRRG